MTGIPSMNPSMTSLGQKPASYVGTTQSDSSTIVSSNLQDALKKPEVSQKTPSDPSDLTSNPGLRSAEAYVRPSPIATVGDVVKYGFDLRSVTFTFGLVSDRATKEDVPTEIFLPEFHFPPGKTNVEVSGGRWRIDVVDVDGEGMQVMKWWHGAGEQNMVVKGIKRKPGELDEEAEAEAGYLDTMRTAVQSCAVM